ncbi:MAG: Crp/Fnr family transcriptional regulator [Pseudomonadota bacterium]
MLTQEQHFRENHLFSALSDEQMERLSAATTKKSLAQAAHLFEAGSRADEFYLVSQGQIKLYRLSPAGQEKVIEIIRPGQTFAEALMFRDIPVYPVNAQALANVELYAIKNAAFIEILRESVDVCFRVMADISVRLKHHLNEIDALTLQNASLRVVNYLSHLIPSCDNEAVEITLPAAKNIIASRLSITPETLSRILSTLSSKGLISVEGLHIKVHDVDGMRSYGTRFHG